MADMVSRRQKLMGVKEEEYSNWYIERLKVFQDAAGLIRFVKAATTVGLISFDYWRLNRLLIRKNFNKNEQSYREFKETIQHRSATRVYQLCRNLGGVYTKLGQYVATLNHLLPSIWTETLAQLQDNAASIPLSGPLEDMIHEELGAPISELFSEFDAVPIAAASLAQVHRAVVKETGIEVAVKLQYPHLASQVVGDLWAMEVLASAVGYFFDDFHYGWLLPEFEETADMELDFNQEKKNSERMKNMLSERKDVHVPFIVSELSSRKILTMEYVRGVRIDDKEEMIKNGLVPLDVAATITSIFGEMIHCHGFVHCDPHPGNLMVRKNTNNEKGHTLLLLDHGMYRRLEPSFRHLYCQLWKALLTQDIKLGKRTASELGIGEIGFETLSLALTFRSSTSKARVGNRMTRAERKELKGKFKGISAGDINRLMESLPRDMLFVLRTNDIIRSLNKNLGGTSRARFLCYGEWSIRGSLIPNVTENKKSKDNITSSSSDPTDRRLNLKVDSEEFNGPNTLYQSWSILSQIWLLHAKLWLLDFVSWTFAQYGTKTDSLNMDNKKTRRMLG
jgi:aarF domain-containing kinase